LFIETNINTNNLNLLLYRQIVQINNMQHIPIELQL